jgi:exopolysaccharide biosynthesis polyprenyl glycosylphosphotransferase
MNFRQGQLSLLFLKSADLTLMLFALGATIVFNYAPEAGMSMPEYSQEFLSTRVKLSNAVLFGLLMFIWHYCFRIYGLYFSNRLSTPKEILLKIMRAGIASSIALLLMAKIGDWEVINLWTTAHFGFIVVAFVGGLRMSVYRLSRRFRQRGVNVKSLLIIGGGARSEELIKTISRKSEFGYRILGYLDSTPAFSQRQLAGVSWLGSFEDLRQIIDEQVVDEVAIALPIKSHYAQIKTVIAQLEEQGVVVHLLSDFFSNQLARIEPHDFQGMPLLSLHSTPTVNWRTEVKRIVDVLGAIVLLTLSAPLFVVIAILIRLDSPGAVFFSQERVGYNKRRFRMIKFRTMVADAEARLEAIEHLNEKQGPIFKISKDPRITRVGRILRKFSLDELPQLINVLLGDMSLVGPRPLSVRDTSRLEESWQKRRFSVRPGLTCLWQISGRSNLSFEEWVALDLKYIDSWSLKLDWWILLKTIPAVITARGAV